LPAVRLVEAKSSLAQANASLRAAGTNVHDTRLTAPASGVIGARSLEPGQTAAPGMPVLQLLDISSVYVRVAVPESEIANVRTGQKAQVTVAAVGEQPLTGKVEEIGVVADPAARTYPVKIALSNASPGRKLMPGMVSSVSLRRQGGQTGVVIPNQTVTVDEQGQNYVYVADGQKAVRRRIKTGALQQQGILVVEGLTPQDQLITSGFQRLSDGAAISVVQ
jgi:membrane fusion protein (multidrug efflux system)